MTQNTMPHLDRIADDLNASEADIAAGRVLPADAVDRMIQERIDRLEVRLSATQLRRVATPRR